MHLNLALVKSFKCFYNALMRLPIRKAGKYVHLKPGANVTEAKFNKLKNKLTRLKAIRPGLAAEVKRLAEFGDFSENAEYQIAKGRLRGVNQGILEIEDHLRRAEIIKPSQNTKTVRLGHNVTIEINGRQKTYLILGSAETNPKSGIISSSSPLGAALIGRQAEDIIKLKLGEKEVEYKIIKITLP